MKKLTAIIFRESYIYVADLLLPMTNKDWSLPQQWKGALLNCLTLVLMTRFLSSIFLLSLFSHNFTTLTLLLLVQGPFDTFLVGGDTAEVCDIKFSNDGKSMLLTTTNNHTYVLDAYGGEKVKFFDNKSFSVAISFYSLFVQNVR